MDYDNIDMFDYRRGDVTIRLMSDGFKVILPDCSVKEAVKLKVLHNEVRDRFGDLVETSFEPEEISNRTDMAVLSVKGDNLDVLLEVLEYVSRSVVELFF